uniref:Coatomer subunit zeta n=1 Tax=Panagrolaimus sp. ES5 TaxID=591445 RepID=A0AC34FAV1_9BILA
MVLDLDMSSLYSIKGIVITDQDGGRMLAKYFDKETFPTEKEQLAFEKSLFSKTHKANSEIILLDGLICVYRSNVDLFFYVIGSQSENELVLVSVLNCLYESVSTVLRKNVEKKALLDNLDIVLLIMDELVDEGYYHKIIKEYKQCFYRVILDTDSTSVVNRCALRGEELNINDQTLSNLASKVREQIQWSLLK